MAEEEKENEEVEAVAEEAPAKSKGPIKIIASIMIMIALGGGAAFLAIPSKETVKRFKGAFHMALIEDKFSTNLRDANQTRFLQVQLHGIYFAYDQSYAANRLTDPMYQPLLLTEVGELISSKFIADSAEGPARESFLEELREKLDPVVFPVHIGSTAFPLDRDAESGLRLGGSFSKATFRGRFHDHVLKVDAQARTLQLDDGEVVEFYENDNDVVVTTGDGQILFVDPSDVQEDFQGEVSVGTFGRLAKVLAPEFIIQ